MKSAFNILSRHQPIHRHAILEASAGTGKTFAIENLVVRLLIEEHPEHAPLLLEHILIVTFTRAATRDLQLRILENLKTIIITIKRFLSDSTIDEKSPDYLHALLEQGDVTARRALRRLEYALFTYDKAQIFTIHGFCWRMLNNYSLEGGISLASSYSDEDPLVMTTLLGVIRDFLRTELKPEMYSPVQLEIILKYATTKREISLLQEKLLVEVNRGLQFPSLPTFSELFIQFQSAMRHLQHSYNFNKDNIIADFLTLAPCYNGLCNRDKQIHSEILEQLNRFASLFDKTEWNESDFDALLKDGLIFIDLFDSSKLKKKAKPLDAGQLHYFSFREILKNVLEPIVHQGSHPASLFSRLASDCQRFVKRYQGEKELFGHHDLLVKMKEAMGNDSFVNQIRNTYQAAIIDEFQDTDPIQWEIFSSLFVEKEKWKGILYLVGDPKQSIYAFRQADIYTYLNAAQSLGNDVQWTLDTNFRSQPSLVEVLNALFSTASTLFPLPRANDGCGLSYRTVSAGNKTVKAFADGRACMQFWVVKEENEEEIFFSAISNELITLESTSSIHPSQCAILVADRYQGARLARYLKNLCIPVKNQRNSGIEKSPALEAMKTLLNGILHYRDSSAFQLALSGSVINLTHDELQEDDTSLVQLSYRLRSVWIEEGFGKFYHELMGSIWSKQGYSLLEQMLVKVDGGQFYSTWQDIADLLIDEEERKMLSPQGVIDFLDQFTMLARNEDPRMKTYQNMEEEGVSILTTHASKGLEFDIVFALGMVSRPKQHTNGIISVGSHLKVVQNQLDSQYQQFCEELDAEKMRQLYVAFTRAKYRLYLPVVIKTKGIAIGGASPMELLLARFGTPTDYQGWYERINQQDETSLNEFVELHQNKGHISLRHLESVEDNISRKMFQHDQIDWIAPEKFIVNAPPILIESFSSLSHPSEQEKKTMSAPHLFTADSKNVHTLPAGEDTGLLLHYILEKLPFHMIKEGILEVEAQIHSFIENTPFESWGEVLAEIIIKAVKTPCFGTNPPFCLADVDPKKMYREAEFLYKNGDDNSFLKGVVDLIFEYEDKYYIVDWKSNWLGPDDSYYSEEFIQEAMKANQYEMQASIYTEGLRRYLSIFEKRPFEEVFGGVYYVFLRGVGNLNLWKKSH